MMRWWADELDRLRDHGTAPEPDIVQWWGFLAKLLGQASSAHDIRCSSSDWSDRTRTRRRRPTVVVVR